MPRMDDDRPHPRPWAALISDLALGALGAWYSYSGLDNLAAGDPDAWLVLLAAMLFASAGFGLIARVRWAPRLGQVAAGLIVLLGAVMVLQGLACAGGFCGLFAGMAFVLGVVFVVVGIVVWFANRNALPPTETTLAT